jgi:NADPH2:quinone reductase
LRAVWYEKVGPAREVLKFGERETPIPNSSEVRVRIHSSGINPSDVKRRAGWGGLTLRLPFAIPHMDGAGVIESVGEGVPTSRIGERVWLYEAQFNRQFGTAAEYSVVPSHLAVRLPDRADFELGATLGVPAMTAHRALFSDGPIDDQTILVSGGAGAVGNYAIQLAKWGRAGKIIATVSSKEKEKVALAAGADYVFNYKTDDVAAKIKELCGERSVDRVIEVSFGSNLPLNLSVLKPNGVIATYASDSEREPKIPFYNVMNRGITVHFILVYTMPKFAHQSAIEDITKVLEQNALGANIAARFPLTEVPAAHEMVEGGKAIGKVLVNID